MRKQRLGLPYKRVSFLKNTSLFSPFAYSGASNLGKIHADFFEETDAIVSF